MLSEIASGIGIFGNGLVGYLIPFLFVLTVVVFFHELGHFMIARLCGVKVLTFSIGFGPEIAGFYDRYNTRWKISAIPLGGYVKFFGDDNAASVADASEVEKMTEAEKNVSFHHQPVRSRAAIVAAGPIANFILAIVIFAGVFMIYGKPSSTARVDSIQEDGVAASAGFRAGDVVVSIDGREIESFADMQRVVSTSAGKRLDIVVDRGGVKVPLSATPALREVKDNFGNVHRIGVLGITRSMSPQEQTMQPVNPAKAVWMGAEETWFIIDRTLAYLGGVVAGQESGDQLGGPGRIAQVAGQVWQSGFSNGGVSVALAGLLHLTAVLSVSIGLLNLFPVPLLDGGHLMFYAIETVRRRPLSERSQEFGFRIGLALVTLLMIFAIYNDGRFVVWPLLRNLAPS